ncbi:MAG: protein kinase [Oscillospiraceae bacterium]|nr:protein kinase [Oscillospiraceae bacterium]
MKVLWPGWETVRVLGRGSFGAVYEIERDVLGHREKAALKVITIPQSGDEIDELYSSGYDEASITAHFRDFLTDIIREYTLMAEMKGHTNVVTCDDIRYVQHSDGFGWDIFIRMELLTPLLKAAVPSDPEEQAVRLGRDLCRALALCRSRNILHRDIKPQNIFVSNDGDYKLGDFGIAKTVEKTSGGTKIGTYNYMAPEVYNNRPYGHTADICSLGLVLYWLLNERRLPFVPLPPAVPKNADAEQARIRRFAGEPIPEPLHGSKELKRIVLKACAFDPKERYQSAEEMLRDLEALGDPAAAAVADADATVGVFGAARAADEEETATVGVRRPRPEKQSPGRAEASRQPRAPQTARKTPPKRRGAKWPLLILLPLAVLSVIVIALVLGRGMEKKAADGTEAPTSAPEAAASAPAEIPADAPDSEVPAEAQTLTGTAAGFDGDITVEVVATDERIYQICVLENEETEFFGTLVFDELPARICESQSLKVDAVSGATVTSNGVKAAVMDALEKGGIDPAVFGGVQPAAPTPEPPLTASVSTSVSGGRTLLATASAEASTFINSKHVGERGVTIRYPACAIDGDAATSWQEAADGYGIDQWLTVYLEGTPNVRYLSLWLGNWESGQMYEMNGRPSELKLEFSDGSSVVCQFPDQMAEFEVKLSKPVQTTWVKLTILGAYAGTKWEDTCISEIRVYA